MIKLGSKWSKMGIDLCHLRLYNCFEYCTDQLIYIEEWDKLLCRECLVEEAEKKGIIKSIKYFFDADYNEIASDADCEPVIDYIKEYLGICQEKNKLKRLFDF